MTWFQIWTVCWQISVFLTPIILGAVVLWLNSKFVTKADAQVERNRVDGRFAAGEQAAKVESNRVDGALTAAQAERDRRWELVRDQLADHSGRLKMVETDVAKPPSRHTLNNAISVMQGGLNAVEKAVAALAHQFESTCADLRRQSDTTNTYLHSIIEKKL